MSIPPFRGMTKRQFLPIDVLWRWVQLTAQDPNLTSLIQNHSPITESTTPRSITTAYNHFEVQLLHINCLKFGAWIRMQAVNSDFQK